MGVQAYRYNDATLARFRLNVAFYTAEDWTHGPHSPAAVPLGSRAARSRLPMAKDVVEAVAISHRVCVRPVPLRRIDPDTGATEIVDVPCGATLESKCPPCAQRAKSLRIAQCKAGWHLESEPIFEPDEPNKEQLGAHITSR